MNKVNINKLIRIFNGISTAAVLVGLFFELQHWKYGTSIVLIGMLLYLIVSSFEIDRLKKIIKKLEEKKFMD